MLDQLDPCGHVTSVLGIAHSTLVRRVLHLDLDRELLHPYSEAYLIPYLSTLLDHPTSDPLGVYPLQPRMIF